MRCPHRHHRLFASILAIGATLGGAASTAPQPVVVGYLPTWGDFPANVDRTDLDVITHLDIAFVNPDANATIVLPAGISTVVRKAHAKGVKVLVSIGGGGAGSNPAYPTIMANPTLMDNLVENLVQATLDADLDGIDVDIEGDLLDGKLVTAPQYETFVTKLGTSLHGKQKLMTAALGGWFAGNVTNTAAQSFDLLGVMSYDATGSWSGPGQHSPYDMAVDDFHFWKDTKGVPAERIVVGVPFYGYGWGKYAKDWTFAEIVSQFPGNEGVDQIGSGSDVIYYNGMETIRRKAVFSRQNAGGIMIWELTQDAPASASLLNVIAGVYGKHSSVPDNLAKGRPVAVSSQEAGDNIAANLTDGSYSTRWASTESDPQWFQVDLGEECRIDEVRISWETALGKDFVVQASPDNRSWTTVKTVVGNADATNDFKTLSAQGRYVRIDATARGTIYGYSVYELEVYGKPVSSVVTPRERIEASLDVVRPYLRDHRGSRIPLSATAQRAILEGRFKEASLPTGVYVLQTGSLPGARTLVAP